MNNNYYAVKLDVSSKQKYIFSSNRMKEVVGASKIIEFVTEILGHIIIDEMINAGLKVNHHKFTDENERLNDSKETERYRGTVHTEGGGNAIYMFESESDATTFIKKLSKYVLEHFDGLEITMVMQEFDIRKHLAVELYRKLELKITKAKNNHYGTSLLNYGMYDRCENSGKAKGYEVFEIEDSSNETDLNKVSKLVSKESHDKRLFYDVVLMEKVINSKFNQTDQGKDTKDPFGINKYTENKDSLVMRKIQWMKSYYIYSNEKSLAGLLDKDEYKNKTVFKGNELEDLKNNIKASLNQEIRIEAINDIAGFKSNKDDRQGSMIGLSCLDGNGMGNTLGKLPEIFIKIFLEDFNRAIAVDQKDAAYYERIKNGNMIIGEDVELSATAQIIIEENNILFFKFFEIITEEIQKTYESAFIQMLASGDDRKRRPIVPIIIAGDDISFWSSGSECIDVSAKYITIVSAFEEDRSLSSRLKKAIDESEQISKRFKNSDNNLYKTIDIDLELLTVSGGVAITATNYPISKSFKLASKLESKAKRKDYSKANNGDKSIKPGVLDWELVRGEIGDIDKILANRNTARPYIVVDCSKKELIKFEQFRNVLDELEKTCNEKTGNEKTGKSTSHNNLFRKMTQNENEAIIYLKKKKLDKQYWEVFANESEHGDGKALNAQKNSLLDEEVKVLKDAIEVIGLYKNTGKYER